MKYIEFDNNKEFDLILLGRVAVDLNPVDYYCPLNESTTFKRYLGGSPANIAVGLARLGKKCGFLARVSDDQLGTFVTDYFDNEGIDTTHIKRCRNGEKIGLTFTEIKSETESSIVMYRNEAADLKLDVEDIDEDYINKAKAILISGTALAESPSREAALKAVALARKTVCQLFLILTTVHTTGKTVTKSQFTIHQLLVMQILSSVLVRNMTLQKNSSRLV